jgi:hypothetical protein
MRSFLVRMSSTRNIDPVLPKPRITSANKAITGNDRKWLIMRTGPKKLRKYRTPL